ncbi:hypothetical protein ACFQWB_08690 [Paenibacillus thermoaerophilus]|uniref:Uncharacterized protein n=1 Tax=Paenibacillus thermoaerophilus TaxID=1215385 RepID=A0ABW2V1K0_9BACL|nr:hypothetical protein [Paenibacillus thermoaerophilus]TMV18537.1 hypothetical protein FE781_03780 [Paenibacillus thermoaerophilus]
MLLNRERPSDAYRNYNEFYRYTQIKQAPAERAEITKPPARHDAELALRAAADGLRRTVQSAVRLHAAAEGLKSDSPASVWNRRITRTSHPHAMEVRVVGTARPGSIRLEILRPASAQVNRSRPFPRGAAASDWKGVHEFELRRGDSVARGTVVLFGSDTYGAALRRLRDAVNATSFGIAAQLLHQPEDDTVQLAIRSTGTGSGQAFLFSDFRGRLAEWSGLDSPSVQAEDLLYRLDGGEPVSHPEGVIRTADGALEIRVKEATGGTAVITVEADRSRAADRILRVVEAYNAFLKEAHQEFPAVRSWLRRFYPEKPDLPEYGIVRENDGFLRPDRELLADRLRASPGPWPDPAIAGPGGWADRLLAATEALQTLSTLALLPPAVGWPALRPLYGPDGRRYRPKPLEGWIVSRRS